MQDTLEHPSVWIGTELPKRSDWHGAFDRIHLETLRDRLENGSGAVLLRGFPLKDHSKDSAREAFRAWCSGVGTLLSQNESGSTLFDVSDAGLGKHLSLIHI